MTFNQLILIAYRICRGINFVRPTNDVASNFHVIGGNAVSHSERILTVISYYKHRSREYLDNLMAALVPIADHLLVVINDDEARTANFLVKDERLIVLSRPNIGMNIGAWDAGYRSFPDFDQYIFLQDECILVDPNYQERYSTVLRDNRVGMTGDSLNQKWSFTWQVMQYSPLNYDIVLGDQKTRTSRVSFYLECMKRWGINPGATASHLRGLSWGFKNDCLRLLEGFPIGRTKEECIAAEIAVSRKVAASGFVFCQINNDPFSCFAHQEWRRDGYSKI